MTHPDNSELVLRWKSLFQQYNQPNLGLDEKAVILKNMLAEIQYHRKLGRISDQCFNALTKKYTKEYARITQVESRKENSEPRVKIHIEGSVIPECVVSTESVSKRDSSVSESGSSTSGTGDVSVPPKSQPTDGTEIRIKMTSRPEKVEPKLNPKTDQSLLNLWSQARQKEDNPLLNRPEKRKHACDSPISNKSCRSEPVEAGMLACDFLTAGEQLRINQMKRNGVSYAPSMISAESDLGPADSIPQYGKGQKSLGTRRGLSSKFVPPIPGSKDHQTPATSTTKDETKYSDPIYQDERLKNCEARMIELILSEIMDNEKPMSWDDIAGLEFAKKTIQEIVVWPMLRPDIFTGLRGPPKGLLLFGPPGTGKTLIGKCIASQSKSTFFTISASSLTSKWVGEGEKMVRTLFTVARCQQPAVVFIDEIDSLLTQRSDQEHESSRRIKTEFLVQLDGACTASDERLLVIGATNRPQEIDEAARRRFVKRLYIPLPEREARRQIVENLLHDQKVELTDSQLVEIGEKTDGYSGSDMANLCREAALGPIRSIPFGEIHKISADDVRSIQFGDFLDALEQVKASVSDKDLNMYVEWNNKFGSGKR